MSTEHIARARRVKAVALATILHEAGAAPEDVAHMTGTAWLTTAKIATRRALLGTTPAGKARIVHPPHSAETVAAVERELRMLQVVARVEVEQPRTDAGRPGRQLPADAIAEIDTWKNAPAVTVASLGVSTPWTRAMTTRRLGPAERYAARGIGTVRTEPVRRATDSQGYRQQMARIAPLPEDPFAAFATADQPHAIR